jgi:hypothetical protein
VSASHEKGLSQGSILSIKDSDLHHFVNSNHVFQRPLTVDAINLIFIPKAAVREDENKAAPEADSNMI